MTDQPRLYNIYLFVADMAATLAFYRLLGLQVDEISETFARAELGNDTCMEFGTAELTRSYDPNWREPAGVSTNTIGFELATPAAVDALYKELVSAGYRGHLAPCDPPWQSRFALVDDPDGNVVALHSPRDRGREGRPEKA